MQFDHVLNAAAGGVLSGALFWLLMWLLMRGVSLLRFRGAFPDLVLNVPGEHTRRTLRMAERELLLLTGAACAALATVPLLLGPPPFTGVWMWIQALCAVLLLVAWAVFVVRAFKHWRICRFAARADAAIGAALARLALQGHRVFHGIVLGGESIDHVVVGPRGAYAVKVVAHRPAGEAKTARLGTRGLEFQDGSVQLDPMDSIERGARLLAELAMRSLGHNITVRPVLAVPGWEVVPVQNGELLLVNEKSAVMLSGWSRPDDQLFDEDAASLQERLARLSRNHSL